MQQTNLHVLTFDGIVETRDGKLYCGKVCTVGDLLMVTGGGKYDFFRHAWVAVKGIVVVHRHEILGMREMK